MSDPDREQGAEDPRGDLRWGSIPGLVSDAAARFGEAEAVVDGDVRLTFAQLEADALKVTGAAMAAGIHPGDRVAIWAPNMSEWIVAALGLVGTGAALVPLNTRFKGPEVAYVLNRSRARALFTVRGFLGIDYPAMLDDEDVPDLERIVLLRDDEGTTSEVTKSDEVPIFGWHEFLTAADGVVEGEDGVVGAPVDERAVRARWESVTGEDLSDVIFTSGTTGRPKGAMTTHAQTLRTFATWASIVGLAEGDRYLVVNPFFHTFGYKAGIIACLMQGATIVPEPVFDVDKVLETVAAQRVTVLPGPPHPLPVHPRPPPAGRTTTCPACAWPSRARRWSPSSWSSACARELTFSTVLTAYGLTESTGTVTMCRRGDDPETIASTSGRAIPGLEVRVVDDKGEELRAASPARSWCAATRWSAATSRTPRPPPRPSTPRVGCTPGTSGSWTRPATSASPTARRTCSSWAGSTPIRPRSKARWRAIPAWPRRR